MARASSFHRPCRSSPSRLRTSRTLSRPGLTGTLRVGWMLLASRHRDRRSLPVGLALQARGPIRHQEAGPRPGAALAAAGHWHFQSRRCHRDCRAGILITLIQSSPMARAGLPSHQLARLRPQSSLQPRRLPPRRSRPWPQLSRHAAGRSVGRAVNCQQANTTSASYLEGSRY